MMLKMGKDKPLSQTANGIVTHANETLKKHVGAIHTSGDLSFIERKLSNILLYHAYDELLVKRTHSIPVSILCAMLGWDASKNYSLLKDALKKLVSTPIEFNLRKDGDDDWQVMSILSSARIHGGVCTFRYDEELAEKFYDPDIYSMINLRIQRKFDGAYALNLYENCVRFRPNDKKKNGSTGPWSLPLFRTIVGATSDYYDDFRRLNSKIIKPTVEQINRVSDILITPEFIKQGRSVVAIRFDVANNSNAESQTSLDGLSLKDSIDTHSDIKSMPIYKRLTKHGVSERLAIRMVSEEGAERMKQIVDYTEERGQKHTIASTGAYIKKLVEDKAVVGVTEFQQEIEQKKLQKIKTEQEQQSQLEREANARRLAIEHILTVFDTYTDEQKDLWRAEYAQSCSEAIRKIFIQKGERAPIHRAAFAKFIESKIDDNMSSKQD